MTAVPLLRCPACGVEIPRDALAEHIAAEHRPPAPDRPRRAVRRMGRGRGRR